jgi:PDZ domain
VKLQLGLFVILVGFSLGLGFLIRDRLSKRTHATLVMAKNTVELPFENYGGHLYVKGKVNGISTQDLIVDNGATDLFMGESQAKKLKLVPSSSETASAAKPPNVLWALGALTLKDRHSAVLSQSDIDGLERYFGRRVSGIIGYELFEQLVVELDFQRHLFKFHRPKTYQYSGNGLRIPLIIEGDRAYIKTTITPYGYPAKPGKLMIDLGSNAALHLAAGCGLSQQLIKAIPHTLHRKLATIRGTDEIVLGRVQQVQIEALQIQQPITIFSQTQTNDCDLLQGKIGYQILRQFKVILDYPRRQLILEPTQAAKSPVYDYDLSGLWLEAIGTQLNRYKVGAITKNTPATRAGVKVGDEVKKIGNISASKLTLVQVRQALSQVNQTVNLELVRHAKPLTISLQLKPLI